MKIIAKTKATYEKKMREIDHLFIKANGQKTNPSAFDLFAGIPDADLPHAVRADFSRRTGHALYKYPPQYPDGVTLVLEKTCPYCQAEKEYNHIFWYIHDPHRRLSPNFGYLRAARGIEELNPGICYDCVSTTYHNSRQSSENKQPDSNGGGFWDGFFKGLRGDK